jgi:transcriptional antiterminator RfaH
LARLSNQVLESIGAVETFCPRVCTSKIVGGRVRKILTPLFPGYIFARFCNASAGRYVGSRPGVVGLLRIGDRQAVIDPELIHQMRDSETARITADPNPTFVQGQQLIIREGPFAGMEAEYVSALSGGQRALVFIEYLQQRVTLMAEPRVLRQA